MQQELCSEQKESLVEIITNSIEERTPAGIARTVGRLISTGQLPAGVKLPTVRALARTLNVSPTSVAEAWQSLRQAGSITTEGRRGTFVRADGQTEDGRLWQVPVDPGTYATDLSTGTPDPDLLPPLGPVLSTITSTSTVTSYLDRPVLEELEAHLHDRWPFDAERMTVVNGAMDALDRLITLIVGYGDRVLVEDPTFAPLIDLLELAGAEVIGIPLDPEGMQPELLAEALHLEPRLMILQPRANNPTGLSMTEARAEAIADLLDGSETLIVEDDHSGAVAGAPLFSLGRYLPNRVVHIQSFSKSYGPDLRMAAVGGAAEPIDQMVRRRQLGPSWTSRLLQSVLLQLLNDPQTEAMLANATKTYASRRARLIQALSDRGIEVAAGQGLNLWLPVRDEQWALVALASQGIGAAPGSPFQIDPEAPPHLRITFSTVDDNIELLAERLADASMAVGRRTGPA